MGLCNSPDIFQEKMSELFVGLDTVHVYIDELLHVTKGSWNSDFRDINKRILRQPYTIPKIQYILLILEGFRYRTTLDLNMGYYQIELSAKSKELCIVVTQW